MSNILKKKNKKDDPEFKSAQNLRKTIAMREIVLCKTANFQNTMTKIIWKTNSIARISLLKKLHRRGFESSKSGKSRIDGDFKLIDCAVVENFHREGHIRRLS